MTPTTWPGWFESAAPRIKVVPTLEDALPATTPP
jgi:hypothetical protein